MLKRNVIEVIEYYDETLNLHSPFSRKWSMALHSIKMFLSAHGEPDYEKIFSTGWLEC